MSTKMASAPTSRTRRHFALDSLERIVERFHENASLHVQNQHVCAVGRLEKSGPAAGRACRKFSGLRSAFGGQ